LSGRLICGDDGNSAPQKIANDGLADEAHAAGNEKF
jgi:hypothetical protein